MAVPRGYGEQISYGVHARGTSMTHPSLQIVNGSPFALRFDGSGPLPSGQHLQRGVGKGCGLRRRAKELTPADPVTLRTGRAPVRNPAGVNSHYTLCSGVGGGFSGYTDPGGLGGAQALRGPSA